MGTSSNAPWTWGLNWDSTLYTSGTWELHRGRPQQTWDAFGTLGYSGMPPTHPHNTL